MKSFYKLLFICILAITAVSAGQFALNRIDEQEQEVIQHVQKTREEQLYPVYQQEQALPDLRVNDRLSPQQKEMINRLEQQQRW